jgi:hypothetical protein
MEDIQKPVPKKRGRKPGTKNKPKKVIVTKAQTDLAKKFGIPLGDFAKESVNVQNKKKPRTVKVNWEKLARDLDKALKDEIADNNKHEQWCLEWRKKYEELEEKHKNLEKHLNNVMFVKELKLRGIIDYLEDKIRGNDSV